jgi:two-component system OmpR family response regulator
MFAMQRHIALVEDDRLIRKNYAEALTKEGYKVTTFENRDDALSFFDRQLPDLAILDIMLGDDMEGGFVICKALRTRSKIIPIIFLTARNSDIDKVSGLRLGAWDYLVKDMTTLEYLPARVTALFQVYDAFQQPAAEDKKIEHGNISINESRMHVLWKGHHVSLTLTEFWILHSLARFPGHVKSHTQLMESADTTVTQNAIAAHIRRIREKFREQDKDFSCIQTEYGMGYRWVEE